jgi:tetratricopeptide (TPR) repeat protein
MFIGMAHFDLGQFDLCLDSMRESIEYSKLSGFVAPQVFTQSFLGWTYAWLGQPDRGLATLDEAERVSRKGFPTWVAWPILFRAAIKIRTEDIAGAQAILVPSEAPAPAEGDLSWTYLFLPMPLLLASLFVALGQFEQALSETDRLFEDLARAGMVTYRGDGHMLRARALRALGRLAEARHEVQAAVAICREHKIRRLLWEALSLASDLEAQAANPQAAEGHRTEARQVVQSILSSIPEADLRISFRSTAGVCALLGPPT